jgi:hypothetical protein
MLSRGVFNDVVKLLNLGFFLFDRFLGFLVVFNLGIQSNLNKISLLNGHAVIEVLSSKSLVLRFNFLFKLRNLMLGNLELPVELSDVILSFEQVLGVKILLRTDSLV